MSFANQNSYQTLLAAPPSSLDNQLATPEFEPDTSAVWSSGLFDCCADTGLCCLTCWCPCITFGRIAEAVDHGKTSCVTVAGFHALLTYTGFGWMYSYMYRSKMRKEYLMESSPFTDCLAHFCCEKCALCQEYRELKLRGSIGDDDEHKYGVEAVPVAPKGMSR